MAKLARLQLKIQYKKGIENCATDALSRVGHCEHVAALSACTPVWLQEVLNSYAYLLSLFSTVDHRCSERSLAAGTRQECAAEKTKGRRWRGVPWDLVAAQCLMLDRSCGRRCHL